MSNTYIGYHFTIEPKELGSEILIAELGETAFESFIETETGISAYIQKELWNDSILNDIYILKNSEFQINYKFEEIEQVNWNEEWEKNFTPIDVDGICHVRAPFHEAIQAPFEIIIEPMSFGTGHDATTWQMLKMMSELDFRGWNVFDYGTGTGVLAVFAELLGAGKVLAMDIDDWCIENTIENASVNQCESILAIQGTVPPSDQDFDCILANINRHILLENMDAMAGCLKKEGLLLISGFYAEEDHILISSAEKYGLLLEKNSEKSEWSCLQFRKK